MHIAAFIHQMLLAGAHDGILPVAITLSTLLLEDATAVFAGILSAKGFISPPIALGALMLGAMIYDFALFSFGRLARTHPKLRKWVEHEKVAPLKSWLHEQLFVTLISACFLPGTRLPTFLACGFFGVPLERFAPRAVLAIFLWALTIFTGAYLFGYFTVGVLGFWRWPIALLLLTAAFLYGRSHVNKFNKMRAAPKGEPRSEG